MYFCISRICTICFAIINPIDNGTAGLSNDQGEPPLSIQVAFAIRPQARRQQSLFCNHPIMNGSKQNALYISLCKFRRKQHDMIREKEINIIPACTGVYSPMTANGHVSFTYSLLNAVITFRNLRFFLCLPSVISGLH